MTSRDATWPPARLRPVAAAAFVAAATLAAALMVPPAPPASAATDPATLTGEGSSFLEPVMARLIQDLFHPQVSGLFGAYTAVGIDPGLADFTGTGPGQFTADFAVTERPLTAGETAAAQADGRAFAYVPIAATPVAVATLVPNSSFNGSGTINPATDLCQHIPISVADLGAIYGIGSPPVSAWSDPRFKCSVSGGSPAANGVTLWANADPTMANYALMAFLDSDPVAKSEFAAGLTSAFATHGALTADPAPSEQWPYSQGRVPGGDNPLIGKLLAINPTTNLPSTISAQWTLGSTWPMSSLWTGAPLGVPLNIPTAAVQNAAGQYVPPSASAAVAAEASVTMGLDNLVTFTADPSNQAAYNSYLMLESYLVVPTSGLAAAKATALANLVRFALGPTGQSDEVAMGAGPATPAMVAAGLHVAAKLDAEAAAARATTTTTTTATTTSTTTPTGGPGGATGSGSTGGLTGTPGVSLTDASGGSSSDGTGSTGGLAFTGAAFTLPLTAAGVALAVVGAYFRRRLRSGTKAKGSMLR